jgi:hypothetical protein
VLQRKDWASPRAFSGLWSRGRHLRRQVPPPSTTQPTVLRPSFAMESQSVNAGCVAAVLLHVGSPGQGFHDSQNRRTVCQDGRPDVPWGSCQRCVTSWRNPSLAGKLTGSRTREKGALAHHLLTLLCRFGRSVLKSPRCPLGRESGNILTLEGVPVNGA